MEVGGRPHVSVRLWETGAVLPLAAESGYY